MQKWIAILCSVLLGACASAPRGDVQQLFADHLFDAPSQVVDLDIFAASPAMRAFINDQVRNRARSEGPREALLKALGSEAGLKLTYDTMLTRAAAQAFDARAGNCLSLVIMAASFAEMMNLRVQFNSVPVAESWSRMDGLYFAAGHVNLSIARAPFGEHKGYNPTEMATVDFLPPEQVQHLRKRPISREAVLAMYLNNRAAEMLAQQRVDDAYWWARAAIERVPTSTLAYNTLGVIYLRRGAPAQAVKTLRYALSVESANTNVMANLAQALEKQGDDAGAAALRERLASLELHPPFHFFDLGYAALQRGDFAAARENFEREVGRNADFHESHFGLALAAYAMGDAPAARRHLRQAIETSGSLRERDIYSAKYEHLRKQMLQ